LTDSEELLRPHSQQGTRTSCSSEALHKSTPPHTPQASASVAHIIRHRRYSVTSAPRSKCAASSMPLGASSTNSQTLSPGRSLPLHPLSLSTHTRSAPNTPTRATLDPLQTHGMREQATNPSEGHSSEVQTKTTKLKMVACLVHCSRARHKTVRAIPKPTHSSQGHLCHTHAHSRAGLARHCAALNGTRTLARHPQLPRASAIRAGGVIWEGGGGGVPR